MKLPCGMDISVTINEEELPLDQFEYPEIQMDGSDQFGIPILIISLADKTGGNIAQKYNPMPDGTLIGVTLSDGSLSVTREYRHSKSIIDGGSMTIRAYLNHPKYIIESTKSCIRDTSYNVMYKIAETCGFSLDCPQTADSMLWQASNQRWINFARHVMDGSYMSDTSMMTGRITNDGVLRVVDLNTPSSSMGLYGYDQGSIPLMAFRPEPVPVANIKGGYKSALVIPGIVAGKIIDFVDFLAEEVSLNRHPRMSDFVGQATVAYASLAHPANLHSNYHRAVYNNKRADVLFNMKAKIVSTILTNIDALDVIQTSLDNSNDGSSSGTLFTSYNGLWRVSSKSIYITQGSYYERFSLLRAGLGVNMDAYST